MHSRSFLFASDFMGVNPGNFIPSLLALDAALCQCSPDGCYRVVYAFPEKCRTFAWCRQMLDEGRTIYFYGSGSSRENLSFLEDVVHRENVVLIHTHFEALGRAVYLFRLRHPSIPIIWHKHNDFTLGKSTGISVLKRRIKDFFIDRFITTVAVSPHLKTPGGHVLLNHLVSSGIPQYSIEACQEFRHSYGLTEDDIMILMFGWDKPRKGVDIGCKMLTYLPEDLRGRCKLCIILEDNPDNRSYIAEHCSMPENVILLKNTDNIFLYHQSADIMLSAARSEAFAYTIFEALAVGTPVVSSDIPGVQWSRAYQNVQFFRTEDPSDCATAITNALGSNDQALNQKIATQVRHDYDIEKWCAQLLSLYRSVGAFR